MTEGEKTSCEWQWGKLHDSGKPAWEQGKTSWEGTWQWTGKTKLENLSIQTTSCPFICSGSRNIVLFQSYRLNFNQLVRGCVVSILLN